MVSPRKTIQHPIARNPECSPVVSAAVASTIAAAPSEGCGVVATGSPDQPLATSTAAAGGRATRNRAVAATTKDKEKTPTTSRARRSVKSVFSKKKFFLDLKTRSVSSAKVRQLVEDIQLLGGTIEDFFSREVTTVISDAPEWKLRNPTGAPDVVSPGTPRSLAALANSPWSPVTPVGETQGKGTSRSRVETILERARQQAKGTSDVIENAHKWGLKIWSLHKILAWLENFKRNVGALRKPDKSSTSTRHYTRSRSVDSSLSAPKELVAPYIKFEVNNHVYRPVFHEFRRFPKLNFCGRAGTSPFYGPDSNRGRTAGIKRLVNEERSKLMRESIQKSKKVAAAAAATTTTTATADPTPGRGKTVTTSKQQPEDTNKADQVPQAPTGGYCELCEQQFQNLNDHLDSPNHNHVVGINSYWAQLDLAIGLVNMNSDDSVVEIGDVIETGPPSVPPGGRHRRRTSLGAKRATANTPPKQTQPLLNGHRRRHRSGNSRCSSISVASSSLSDEVGKGEDDDDDGDEDEAAAAEEEEEDHNDDDGGEDGDEEEEEEDDDEEEEEEEEDGGGGDDEDDGDGDSSTSRLDAGGSAMKTRGGGGETLLNGHTSPRTRATSARNRDRRDDENSFSDSAGHESDDGGVRGGCFHNGDGSYQRPMPASKKKRKSSDEKFLEDNSQYYGIEVLKAKLRSSSEVGGSSAGSFHNSFLDFIKSSSPEEREKDMAPSPSTHVRRRRRHQSEQLSPRSEEVVLDEERDRSDSESRKVQRRRQRILSTKSDCGGGKGISRGRPVREDMSRLDKEQISNSVDDSDGEEGGEEDESPRPRRRACRSELDKLLEAGSSSFHFETARQASQRAQATTSDGAGGLGPIHVDVSDQSNSGQEDFSHTKVSTRNKGRKEEDATVGRPSRKRAAIPATTKSSSPKKKKKLTKGRGRANFRRPLLTKADLLEGPVIIPPKEELIAQAKAKRQKPKGRKKRKTSSSGSKLNDYLPSELFQSLQQKLDFVDDNPIDVDEMLFSFEKRPLNEVWFQTYSRQDAGDEILYYPETKWFPLPYEMPSTTFYPSKGKKKLQRSFVSSVEPSGTATPVEEPLASKKKKTRVSEVKSNRKDSKASSTDSDCSAVRRASGILARLGSKLVSSLLGGESARKSPRGHASTKALLNNTNPLADEEEEEEEAEDENIDASAAAGAAVLDEASNDSTIFKKKRLKQPPTAESMTDLVMLSSSLDTFLREVDPQLMTDVEEEHDIPQRLLTQKRKKRRRSSGRHAMARQAVIPAEDPMDRLVASNVDPVLLDCLEDETPSVAIDDDVPGSTPFELLAGFATCDSMAKCEGAGRWLRKPLDAAVRLRRSLKQQQPSSSSSSSSSRTKDVSHPIQIPPPPVAAAIKDDTSSECCSSACEDGGSSSSSSSRKRKKRRNLTGFPSPKKKKKKSLLNDVLTRNSSRRVARDLEEEDSDAETAVASTSKKTVKISSPPRKSARGGAGCMEKKNLALRSSAPAAPTPAPPPPRGRPAKAKNYREVDIDDEDADGDEEDECFDSEEEEVSRPLARRTVPKRAAAAVKRQKKGPVVKKVTTSPVKVRSAAVASATRTSVRIRAKR